MSQPDFEILLRETIGLDVGSIGSNTVERAVKSRMENVGIKEPQVYWEYLHNSADELQELIESIVVPETWFFRDREAFSVMVRLISRSWFSLPVGPPLRVLSVPCSTGEEPYSIAIALSEAGLATNRMQVDAVDVSRQAIVRAKRGAYGSNSFRGNDLAFRDRFFERFENTYTIVSWLSDLVTFYHENLFSPSFRLGARPYDIIFCRNVLIYFDRAKQEAVMATLSRLLKDDGYLFVGPAEAVLASRNGFRALNETMSFAFSKERRPPLQLNLPAQLPLKQTRREPLSVSSNEPASPIAGVGFSPIESKPNNVDGAELERIKNLADAGQFDQASILCEKYLEQYGKTSEVYYLLGIISDAKGESERAIDCYRKVLYLAPDHSETLMHLALLFERQGHSVSAKRLRERARRSETPANSNRSSGETVFRRGQ